MVRWQVTLGLTALAALGALVAPRLLESHASTPGFPLVAPPLPAAPQTSGGSLGLEATLDRGALLAGTTEERFLLVSIAAEDVVGAATRRPVDLGVVMDASGSMAAQGKMDYARDAARLLVDEMASTDIYSLVSFSNSAEVILPASAVTDRERLHAAIDRVREGGGTNLSEGLVAGAGEIRGSLSGRVGRLVLLSDGNANLGVTDPLALGRAVTELRQEGITVSAIGLGIDYNEDLLAKMADLGGGTYDFVDDPRELRQVLADELDRSASVVARSVQLRIDLPEGVEGLEVIGWTAERTASGWTVDVGDVYAGDSRKIVARVRVAPHATGSADVASAALTYVDIPTDAPASAGALARADVTPDLRVVEASVNDDAAAEAHRAWGNQLLDRSSRAYADGDVSTARELVRQGSGILAEAASAFSRPDLAEEAEDLRTQEALYDNLAPASPEGRAAVKSAKEKFRGRAR